MSRCVSAHLAGRSKVRFSKENPRLKGRKKGIRTAVFLFDLDRRFSRKRDFKNFENFEKTAIFRFSMKIAGIENQFRRFKYSQVSGGNSTADFWLITKFKERFERASLGLSNRGFFFFIGQKSTKSKSENFRKRENRSIFGSE
jgi:hypothetical protein